MVKVIRNVQPKDPVLIAAWPGMGHVALKAAQYLRDKLKARFFAALAPEKYFYPNDISIEKSLIDVAALPEGRFYYWENKQGARDIIIFIGEQQPPVEKSIPYAHALLDFAQKIRVRTIVTFAALVSSIDFVKVPKAWLAVTHRELVRQLAGTEAKPLEYGQVSGLNGLVLGMAKKRKMRGLCFLGEIPFYAAHIENPRSSMVVLSALTRYLDITVDLTELSIAARIIEEEIEKLISHVKRPPAAEDAHPPISGDDIERIKSILDARSHIPESTKRQIEGLFAQAQDNPSRAMELKKLLDEWNVYREYEDRFLALFRPRDDDGTNG